MTNLPVTQALTLRHQQLAHQFRHAFERLGIHDNADGSRFLPRVKRIAWTQDGNIALVELDEQRLWHIPASRLTNPDVVRKLRRIVGQPVAVLDRDHTGALLPGILYVVSYAPRVELPAALRLTLTDLAAIPAGQYRVPLGQAKGEAAVTYRHLPDLGHVLIGSATQRGKTSLINAWLAALTARHTPDQYQVIILDAKATTLHRWQAAPHCGRYATTPDAALAVLDHLARTVTERFDVIRAGRVDNWSAYNAEAAQPLPALHVIVDELPDFILQSGGVDGPLAVALSALAGKCLGAGVFLTLAGTEMSGGTVPRMVQANIGTRIGFQMADRFKSLTVLQAVGAEKLPAIKGRALWRDTEHPDRTTEAQMVYFDGADVDTLLAQISQSDQPAPADRPTAAFVPTVEGVPPALAADVARWCLGNTTGVRAVWEAFKARGLSRARAGALLSEWAALGLLGEPASVTADRPITDQFRAILAQL